ncbi:hypothetical protein ACWDE9_28985, partial [Streptomyces olivaceoviridis]
MQFAIAQPRPLAVEQRHRVGRMQKLRLQHTGQGGAGHGPRRVVPLGQHALAFGGVHHLDPVQWPVRVGDDTLQDPD